MPGSVTSVFGERDNFRTALRDEATISLFITGQGQFLARLTKVDLCHLRLVAVEERLARIGFLAVPRDYVMISFPVGDRPAPICGGIRPRKGEIMMFGPGHRVHVRTQGPCSWGAIWLATHDLAEFFHDLTQTTLETPPDAQLWRPPPAAGRCLLQLHAAAIRAAERRPETIVDAEAAHGMEQQLVDVLVTCLLAGPLEAKTQTKRRDPGITARFEDWLEAHPNRRLHGEDLGAALGVSSRLLRMCCAEDLGMSPTSYIRLRSLHRIRSILSGRAARGVTVSEVARCHGFHDLGRFAATYRSLFGELPSGTLRRRQHGEFVHRTPQPDRNEHLVKP